ncbi:hypothetical protein FisN_3Lh535 [Fistulifera solaris]|uniref:Uncharacterized protein n=1 Tax=Fistulifera solaris TaxID=1519565 RepID=A0A1Z5J930_FISSO|nr:hypothetical protein FisN_3Lh535 [Fistulifera solaris]|eukprot:GAX10328.1 hypothetical protein FisN_3Lh535 [Fistulifera solaris]
MVVSHRIRGVEPPSPRRKVTPAEKDQKVIRNDMSAPKQTIGIPRVSRNIARELRELDEAVQCAGHDESTGSQRDEYLIDNLPDTRLRETTVGRSSSSRASRKSQRSRGPSLEEAVKKTVLLAATIENNCRPAQNNKLPSPDIDFILTDLNRSASTIKVEKSPRRAVPMTPRYRSPVQSTAKTKEHASDPSSLQTPNSIQEDAAKKAPVHSLPNQNEIAKDSFGTDDWNPFDSSTCVTTWASEVKFSDSFAKSSFVADFDNAFVVSSQLSM